MVDVSSFFPEAFISAVTFCHQNNVNSCDPASVKPAALNLFSRDIRSQTMKTIFAALASALLVSTAFAQTAAPVRSGDQQTQAAGQANLKAGGATSADAAKVDTSARQANTGTEKSEAKVHAKKTGAARTQKTQAHKVSEKNHAAVASTEKTKATGDSSKEASTAPVKTDGAKTDATKTN
jgi:hypothetical protein